MDERENLPAKLAAQGLVATTEKRGSLVARGMADVRISEKMVSNETVVAWGIDLGTTNSTLCRTTLPAGATSPTEPEVVSLRQPTIAGEFTGTLLPSIVATYQGREFVGQGAKDLRALMADATTGITRNVNLFHDCKNEIGTKRTYSNAPEGYRSPTDIAARILGYLRREEIGEAAQGNVVVTVPASFQAAQRAETALACMSAGIDVSGGRLLDEPVAAFIDYAYRYDRSLLKSITGKKNLLVFDFGGGTCDIALFGLTHTEEDAPVQVTTRSVSRFHRLGGGDIDLAILHRVLVPQLCTENGLSEFDLSFQEKTKVITPALIAVAEALKIQICNEIWRLQQFGKLDAMPREDIVARYPAQVSMRQGERMLKLSAATITAVQFDDVLTPFLNTKHLFARSTEYRLENSIFAPVADALERAQIEPAEIDFVLAVGGSSLIPLVMDALRGYFPRARMLQYEDRKDAQLAVARGASLHALALATSGRGIIAPVVQDDIYLVTKQGDLKLVAQGAALPVVGNNDSLTVPEDAFEKTVWLFRERLAEHKLTEKLFARFHEQLAKRGFVAKGGQMIDATFVEVPRQRNSREENEQIKAGVPPKDWDDKLPKKRQKDVDARWAKKGDETHYGYKNHVNTDDEHKLVQSYAVSDASVHDSQVFDELPDHALDENGDKRPVYADSAYRSAAQEEKLAQAKIASRICEKGARNHPLTDEQKAANKAKSKSRVRVEHVFGTQAQMGGHIVRTIGLMRAAVKIGLMNLAYNMKRLGQLLKYGAKSVSSYPKPRCRIGAPIAT